MVTSPLVVLESNTRKKLRKTIFLSLMAVAEIFITPFITVLFDKLASADLIGLARSAGIYSQLARWNKTLSQIQSVLADAGQKQTTEKAVQLWLHDLQDLAYDIDDVLDDLATEAMRRKLNQESNASKVLRIISTCYNDFTPHSIMYGRKMSFKLDEITTRLHNLVEQKNILGLNENIVERLVRRSRRMEETSLVDESEIVGRDGDKEALLGMLLGNETCKRNVSILSIVGLGGIGKTTLAQVLYNEKKVKDHFELMAWVCVSDEFDVFNISNAIYQAVVGENRNFANLNLLQEALKEKLSNNRFLFVLDDMWNEDYKKWQLLQRPFVVGANGSKIIITTRKTSVASMMDPVSAYCLDVLSNEEAFSLLAQHALGEQNFDKHPSLKLHGEAIVKKCNGLPLALIMLGRVLRTKTNDEDWEELLNSEIWNLQAGNEILPSLRLSYYDLPSHLKQVFAYCSLFIKDYVFDKDELVLLWMAEGFLYESNGNKSMECLGDEYFEELKCRFFFQHVTNEKSQYKMHDLINDLATSIAEDFFLRFDDKMYVYDRKETMEKSRHVSLAHDKTYILYKKFMALQKGRRMRTFLLMPFCARFSYLFLSTKAVIDLLPQLQFLRVIRLTNCSITEIPQSIGSLKHVRYLNFSGTHITCLPEQVSELSNLQSLLICDCFQLTSLPKSFVKLLNLRHLDINGTPMLNKIPDGIGRLTSLQTLSKVIIEGENGFKITELKGLLHLHGRLSITGLHKVINAIHAKEANLGQKTGVNDLVMEWGEVFDHSRNELTEYEVLEALRPHNRLRNLKICFYQGSKFPNWVGDATFVQLTQLTLQGCTSCRYLPTLGHLSSLQKLYVKSMKRVKTLGFEFLGLTNSYNGVAFPSLEVLTFDDMQGWEIWSTYCGDGNRVFDSFPCLHEISIENCPKLSIVSIGLIPSLRVLNIQGCCEVVFRSMVCVSSSILRLTIGYINGLTRLNTEVLGYLGGIEYLCIRWCYELKYLWELESQACDILVSLEILRIESCERLVSLGNKYVNLESIKKVNLRSCQRLKSYNCPKSIEKLVIFGCPSLSSLTFPTKGVIPSSMKILDICGCDNLEESWLLHNFLSTLFICRLPNLRTFPEGCLVHLTDLTISNCDIVESIREEAFGYLPQLHIRSLHIINCKNLKSFPYDQFQSVTSLEVLSIRNCPSLDCSFPCGMWPPNLTALTIGGLKKPMSKWGLQNFPTSLVRLHLHGENSGVGSFASWSFSLPPSLTFLQIRGFMDLESISEGLQRLTCIEQLHIGSCPKLRDLPETLLPLLSGLSVKYCGKLQNECSRKGKYWSIISQIPFLDV